MRVSQNPLLEKARSQFNILIRGFSCSHWSQKKDIVHPLHNAHPNATTGQSEVGTDFALLRQLPPMQGLTSGHDIPHFRTLIPLICVLVTNHYWQLAAKTPRVHTSHTKTLNSPPKVEEVPLPQTAEHLYLQVVTG